MLPSRLILDICVTVAFRRSPGMRQRPQVRRPDELGVFPDRTGIVIRLPWLPGRLPFGQFGRGQGHVDGALVGVDDDLVAVAQQADRSADCRLRPDMANAEATRGARE